MVADGILYDYGVVVLLAHFSVDTFGAKRMVAS